MPNGLIWCYIQNSQGNTVSAEDLFPLDGEGWGDDHSYKLPSQLVRTTESSDLYSGDCVATCMYEDDMANTENAIYEHLEKVLPTNQEADCWQFEIGADAFSGVLDYSLKNPLPEIPPFTFTLREKTYTIYFPPND